MAKPDNRADNEVHLQEHINHTLAKLHAAEDYLDEHADEIKADEKQAIEAKNDRRKESIDYFIAEKKDEARD
ncbi:MULTISPECIES: small acid-soluble spore protein Tlp [Desulfosporosinus]|uniref:Protein Tlp homolog n=1 Tax=Desulfosporosinus nitroreducens TaxID=2018668 RepID=A0ABT8QX19_9FIRM|nr:MULTISPECIES: small acid-soluble spore protein Tlp [Desulfosporosinus]MCO1604154.1 small acid-soluble spore protein Tlp [Desulfosporosinus nitroreducens]MDO0825119.1 small acid-soluble spore protein Tlp [Desulfosporosinus nitroreducens]